ncbi:glutaredoxin family protein [Thalassotalea piscium]|uniref:Glutaredoxin n=1 Tax=Thalassotalea piscium TaxID=1230533 RepID=A0A7X0NE53_9GAMM|nr:glutaredoxin family protein [Thalassotalea piscium]MBB6541780.1 glutaredoxin [Thalassotalea piscium]
MKKVVLYSSNNCSHCDKAKAFLAQHNVTFRLCNVKTPAGQKELAKAGFRSIPVIKVADEYIVGYNEKQLKKLLALS